MIEFWKIFSVFISCMTFFGKVGMPAAVVLFDFHFLKVFAVTCSGGITGNILFTYVSAGILKWWEKFKEKKFSSKKKVFTRSNRRIIKIKRRFGLFGIAFFTPILLSIPLGAFIAERFYKNKKKVITALSVSVVSWSIALYFLFLFFRDALKLLNDASVF